MNIFINKKRMKLKKSEKDKKAAKPLKKTTN